MSVHVKSYNLQRITVRKSSDAIACDATTLKHAKGERTSLRLCRRSETRECDSLLQPPVRSSIMGILGTPMVFLLPLLLHLAVSLAVRPSR